MKKLFTLALSLAAFGLFAQKVTTQETFVKFRENSGNAFQSNVSYNTSKSVEKFAKDFFKDFDGKMSSKKDELFIDDAKILEVSTNPIDVFVKMVDKGNGNFDVSVGFFNGTKFISTQDDGEAAANAKKVAYRLCFELTKKGLEEQIATAEKERSKSEKEYEKLVKEKEGLNESIEDAKKTIKESEEKLKVNETNIDNQQKDLDKKTKAFQDLQGKVKDI